MPMNRLDEALLTRSSSYVSEGVKETAFFLEAGDGRCLATLYTGASGSTATGFAVCHSYGLELLTLRRTERAIARSLARLGHPVLAFHRRGHGDSSGSLEDATLEQQLQDVGAAIEYLSTDLSCTRLGLIGARFGALLAGLFTRDHKIDRLLLVNPAVNGHTYFRQFFRELQLVQLSNPGNDPKQSRDPRALLRRDGVVDVLGHPVYAHLYDALAEIDLSEHLASFSGDALILQVSKRTVLPRDVKGLCTRLQEGGGRCRVGFVAEPAGAAFGGPAFVSTDDPNERVDIQAPILEHIVRSAEEWMLE